MTVSPTASPVSSSPAFPTAFHFPPFIGSPAALSTISLAAFQATSINDFPIDYLGASHVAFSPASPTLLLPPLITVIRAETCRVKLAGRHLAPIKDLGGLGASNQEQQGNYSPPLH